MIVPLYVATLGLSFRLECLFQSFSECYAFQDNRAMVQIDT